MTHRGFNIKQAGPTILYYVSKEGAGRTPKTLSGLYTDPETAMKDIDRYMNGKEGRPTA